MCDSIIMVSCTECGGKGYLTHRRKFGSNCEATVIWECVFCQGLGKVPQLCPKREEKVKC